MIRVPTIPAKWPKVSRDQWAGLHVVHHEVNKGYGGAQKTGLKRGLDLGASVFAVVHSDGQYAPEIVLDLMKPILEGKAQIVQGSRMVGGGALRGGMPYVRYIPNRVLTLLENLVFGTRMAEFHSGYMLYSRRLLECAPFEQLQDNYNFDAEMIVVAHILGMECAQIPIPTCYDNNVSSLDPIPYGINVRQNDGSTSRGPLPEPCAKKRQAFCLKEMG